MSDTNDKLDKVTKDLNNEVSKITEEENEKTQQIVDNLKKVTEDLNNEVSKITEEENEKTQQIVDNLEGKTTDLVEETKKTEELTQKLDTAENERRKREEEEERRKKEEAKEFSNTVIQMCNNRSSTIKLIKSKVDELNDELKPFVNFEELNDEIDKFENDVQEQKNKIKSLEEKLNELRTEDDFEEFEKELENIKPYADNKSFLEDLETAMKKREDEIEDQVIINEVHAAIDEKAKINSNYTITEQDKDKKAITIIVEASLEEMYNQSVIELKTMEDSKKSKSESELEKGIDDYDLTPMGIDILYDYVIDKKPRSEDSQKKKITQLDKEYNIDIYNLFKGGLLTQFYKDKVYSIGETKDIEEEFKEYSERIETIKKKLMIF